MYMYPLNLNYIYKEHTKYLCHSFFYKIILIFKIIINKTSTICIIEPIFCHYKNLLVKCSTIAFIETFISLIIADANCLWCIIQQAILNSSQQEVLLFLSLVEEAVLVTLVFSERRCIAFTGVGLLFVFQWSYTKRYLFL